MVRLSKKEKKKCEICKAVELILIQAGVSPNDQKKVLKLIGEI